MPLLPLAVPPGIKRAGTQYQSRGRWFDSNLVRWFEDAMRPVGGWQRIVKADNTALTITGVPRAMLSWRDATGKAWLMIGSNSKIYAFRNGVLTDLTGGGTTPGGGTTIGQRNYGAGLFGAGTYGGTGGGGGGSGATPPVITEAANWVLDNFGALPVGVLSSDGKLRSWDLNLAGTMAVVANAPINNRGVVVTPERFVMVLGAGGVPNAVQWASQEKLTDWTPTTLNTAGNFQLATDGRLMVGKRMPRETLLWTDTDLHAAIYIGGLLVYQFESRGSKCGLIGQNAATTAHDVAFWMSDQGFFRYDGAVSLVPCEVFDYVFTRLNRAQALKIHAVGNSQFREVWWYYCSIASEEIDSYVVYNYQENHWSIGTMSRTCGVDRGALPYPMMCDATGALYEHERGLDHTGGGAIYAESAPVEIADGNNTYMLRYLYPDEKALGDVKATIYAAFNPTGPETVSGPYTATAPTPIRVTGRQLRMKLTQQVDGADWRVGAWRADAALAGER